MREKLIYTFLFHLFCISLLLIPDKYQGPVVTVVSNIYFRVVDAGVFILMIAGTIYLFSTLILCLKSQMKDMENLAAENHVEKTE